MNDYGRVMDWWSWRGGRKILSVVHHLLILFARITVLQATELMEGKIEPGSERGVCVYVPRVGIVRLLGRVPCPEYLGISYVTILFNLSRVASA
jgi:hypothetical protein